MGGLLLDGVFIGQGGPVAPRFSVPVPSGGASSSCEVVVTIDSHRHASIVVLLLEFLSVLLSCKVFGSVVG
jgi:hypothetical protein